MNQACDPNLTSFAAQVVERHGGLVEPHGDRLSLLLPPDLSRHLGLPDEVDLGSEDAPLLYGSPVLDRLIKLATERVPVVYAKLDVPYLKKDGFEQVVATDFEVVGGRVSLSNRAETRETYAVAVCHYVALSDERKEGLIQIGVNEKTCAAVPEMESLWKRFDAQFFEAGQIPPQFPACPEGAIRRAMKAAATVAETELWEFLSSMRRRLARDVRNTREYYEALAEEMRAGLSRHNVTEAQQKERLAKIENLPAEMQAKIADLEQKYRIKVTVAARAVLRLLVPVVQILAQCKIGRLQRSVSLVWNPVTRKLDPMVCERCGQTSSTFHPAEKKSRVELVCPACTRRN